MVRYTHPQRFDTRTSTYDPQPDQNRSRRRVPFEVLFRQFNNEIQRSGILTEIKKRRYFAKEPSRMLKKLAAIRKADRKRQLRGY